jgi:5-methylcytosine-specific restriction protein B
MLARGGDLVEAVSFGPATDGKINEVVEACRTHGGTSIIALAGVPGTGKSFVANIAAARVASDILMVREIQFHPSYSYEEFIEGYRPTGVGGFDPAPGVFLEWNEIARADVAHTYVLLIEELTRANLPAVLGEVLTYIEHRDRAFFTMYSRRPVTLATNLILLASYNPRDRSALELDDAVMRRLRIISFPPDEDQLSEMLSASAIGPAVIERLRAMFRKCREEHEDFDTLMPFGHGIFAGVNSEADLHDLWEQRIRPMLWRPLLQPHAFAATIKANYPWREKSFKVAVPPDAV